MVDLVTLIGLAPVLAAPLVGLGLARFGRAYGARLAASPLAAVALAVALWACAAPPSGGPWVGAVFGWVLIGLAAIDARRLVLPDALTAPLLAAGLARAIICAGDPRAPDVSAAAVGALAGGATLWLVAWAHARVAGRAGLGMGDVKLFAALGAWLGWQALPETLLIASLSGLAMAALCERMRRRRRIAFGPHLAAAGWLGLIHGPFGA